jgi:hypothetical protein
VGTDQHVYQLIWNPNSGWAAYDISALAGAPLAAVGPGALTCFIDAVNNAPEVYYVGTDQHVHQLIWAPFTGWNHNDITAATGAPNVTSSGGITGLFDSINNFLEIYYVATDQHVHQLLWSSSTSWENNDITQQAH